MHFLRSIYGVTCGALLVVAALATAQDPRGLAVFVAVLVPISIIRLLWTIRADLRSVLAHQQAVSPRFEAEGQSVPSTRDLVRS
jgi:hypothetical protein